MEMRSIQFVISRAYIESSIVHTSFLAFLHHHGTIYFTPNCIFMFLTKSVTSNLGYRYFASCSVVVRQLKVVFISYCTSLLYYTMSGSITNIKISMKGRPSHLDGPKSQSEPIVVWFHENNKNYRNNVFLHFFHFRTMT